MATTEGLPLGPSEGLAVAEGDLKIMVPQEEVGGYSGGGSGTHQNQAGGGGGSYCSGSNCSGVSGGNSNDNGLVKIEELSV